MQDPIRPLQPVIFEYAVFSDGEQGFKYVSDGAFDLIGVHASDLRKDPSALYTNIYPEDHHLLQQSLRVSQDGPSAKTKSLRVRIRCKNEMRWAEFFYAEELTANGHTVFRGVIQEKITSHDTIHLEGPSQYEKLLEKLPIGVVIHHQGIVAFANRHANVIIGAQRPGQLLGLNAMNFVHPDFVPGIAARIKRVSDGDSVPMVEEKFICLDGKVIDVETMAFPFFYKGKAAIHVIFRDITEKKKAQEQVRKSETLFSQLFQNVPMAVVMLDENGKVSEINRGFEQMFGYAKHELRGKNLNDFIVPEDLRSEGIDLNNLIASNRVVSVESIRKHRSGKLINVILCGVPVMFDNEAIGIYGVYVDISDRKKVEEELKIRNTELDNFVYKVSHDLRAPLSSVLGLVNLSKLQGNTDNPLEYINIIGEKIQALDHFIGDVLSHSKNLKMDVDISLVDLAKIIEQTFTDLGYLDGARKTKRSVRIEGIEFYSDPWRISEIFRNLVSNAIKYRKPDSDDSEIVIKINVDQVCADVSFADNGIGIKDSSLKRIFEMFYRATDQSEGSGIGLYIVKNAVEKLGGQIKVASSPGEGTRFHILLPNKINSSQRSTAISAERQ
ncbi:MAG: PAS domain S-box protein [Chryseosolibacter sp.]